MVVLQVPEVVDQSTHEGRHDTAVIHNIFVLGELRQQPRQVRRCPVAIGVGFTETDVAGEHDAAEELELLDGQLYRRRGPCLTEAIVQIVGSLQFNFSLR